jgi:hypothetical protein
MEFKECVEGVKSMIFSHVESPFTNHSYPRTPHELGGLLAQIKTCAI